LPYHLDNRMRNYYLEGSSGVFLTPSIKLNADTGVCEIVGESYLENTADFYDPILDWIEEYAQEVRKPLIFNVRLTYFNTSSSKSILDIMLGLRKYQTEGGQVTINWYYPDDDLDLLAEAEDFSEDCRIPFNMIPYKLDY